ncbi:MAG TPA: transketolase [Candidatus Dormibacteraeota bacterium]|nr:transketolase [Candidatus Dormibacteraeota bacterium]
MANSAKAAPAPELIQEIREKARLLRIHSMRMTTAAGSGHPTSCLSCAELMAGTFFHAMKMDPNNPDAPTNDRFVMSKGHAAPILYAALAEAGVFPVGRLLTLRQFSSELEGHPTPRIRAVDAATGSLGQGLSVGLGLALGARLEKRPVRIYVLMGDGEMAEGNVWEAAAVAAYHHVDNLVALADVNSLGQSQRTMYSHDAEVYRRKFESQGWETEVIDGHDVAAVLAALDRAQAASKPYAIVARTEKGHGVSFLADKEGWHGKPLNEEQLSRALAEMGDVPPVPAVDTRSYARDLTPPRSDFPSPAAPDYKLGQMVATRVAFGDALAKLGAVHPRVVALDGDVQNSTYTETFHNAFPDRFFQGFIAEQNMVATAAGFSARGWTPFAATFACFLGRAFDQTRMAAISRTHIKLVGSHCGISIGEDGPSQMGLEDLAAMRTLPGATVLYPSDAVCAEKMVEAAASRPGICYIRTSRPKTAVIYPNDERFPVPGFKVVRRSDGDRAAIVAAGITLHEALKAADALKGDGIAVRVIDLYCVKPINGVALGAEIAGAGRRLVTVEDHYPEGGLGEAVLGALAVSGTSLEGARQLAVTSVPHSGKEAELLAAFGISAEHIIQAVRGII